MNSNFWMNSDCRMNSNFRMNSDLRMNCIWPVRHVTCFVIHLNIWSWLYMWLWIVKDYWYVHEHLINIWDILIRAWLDATKIRVLGSIGPQFPGLRYDRPASGLGCTTWLEWTRVIGISWYYHPSCLTPWLK